MPCWWWLSSSLLGRWPSIRVHSEPGSTHKWETPMLDEFSSLQIQWCAAVLLKSCRAAFLMAQQGELSRVSDRMATSGANWSTATPRPEPRTRACIVWTAHTCKSKDKRVTPSVPVVKGSYLVWLWGRTCGRSSVWSQLSGRGALAVSSKVCILWPNSDLVLLVSPAEQIQRMSIGKPAARRVTDVKRGDCTTFNPCWETISCKPAV